MSDSSSPATTPVVPAWDRETDLAGARAQIRVRVGTHDQELWLQPDIDPARQLAGVAELGDGAVLGADMVLWTWNTAELAQLSTAVASIAGTLVFLEPTAGLGIRRMTQRIGRRWFRRARGHHYERDVPAELRAAGFIVTTQVRLRERFVGDYVRGEARHFPQPANL